MSKSVALQINLTPADLRHVGSILPHQIRTWHEQVEHILLTVDTKPSHGRYVTDWKQNVETFKSLLESIASGSTKISVRAVDYSMRRKAKLSQRFLGGDEIPEKDLHGAPFHAYLDGLEAAECRYVLHTDSDVLYGGGSPSWMSEMLERMDGEGGILIGGPFPGPPTRSGEIPVEVAARMARAQEFGSTPIRVADSAAFRFKHMSTRTFLIDLERFDRNVGSLEIRMTPPPRFSHISPGVAPLEVCFSGALHRHKLWRLDMLGTSPGMWVLHPPYRNRDFYERLPDLVLRVERGDVPDEQRGDFDMNDSMVDWSAERRNAMRRRHRERIGRAFGTARELLKVAKQ